mgnify:FL=1
MAGSVKSFRDSITLYYVNETTVSDMGSRNHTYTTYDVWADVNQLSSDVALRYGVNEISDSYSVRTRPPASGRPVNVLYNSETYRVISSKMDKHNQWLDLIIVASR